MSHQRCRLTDVRTTDPEVTAPGLPVRWWQQLVPEVKLLKPWLYTSERIVLFSWLGRIWVLWRSKTPR